MLSTAAGSSVLSWQCVNCVCAPRIHFRLASAHRVTDNQGQVCIAQCVVGTFSKYCAPLLYISVRIVLTANLLCDWGQLGADCCCLGATGAAPPLAVVTRPGPGQVTAHHQPPHTRRKIFLCQKIFFIRPHWLLARSLPHCTLGDHFSVNEF